MLSTSGSEAFDSSDRLEGDAIALDSASSSPFGDSERLGDRPSQLPPLRFEAEDMQLANYRLEDIQFASGGLVASFRGEQPSETGELSMQFSGAAGAYDIVLGYFDEQGAAASLDPLLNGNSLGKFRLDRNIDSARPTPNNLVRRVVAQQQTLKAGDTFKILGSEDNGEPARVDYVDFIPVAGSAPLVETDQSPEARALQSGPASSGPIRINAGGEDYTDQSGQTWLSDRFFVDGSRRQSADKVWDTPNDPLFQSARTAKTLDYKIPVEKGTYDIKLLFAETQFSGEGQRVFDIAVGGKTVRGDVDIFRQVGKDKAFEQTIKNISVSDGSLDISLKARRERALLAGIEVVPVAAEVDRTEPTSPAADPTNFNPNKTVADQVEKQPKPLSDVSQPRNGDAKIRYITPNGGGNGESWNNAGSLRDLNNLIDKSAPGDEIWIAGDLGEYDVSDQLFKLDEGGNGQAPVYIRGVASKQGGKDTPVLVGDRADNWSPGKADGEEVFRIVNGASHLHFSNLEFRNVGNGAFRLGGDLNDITIENIQAKNVRRFVENTASGGRKSATVKNLTLRDIRIEGFSKEAIRLQYNTHDVLIEDVFGDSQRQEGDDFAMGVHLEGTVHNVVHRRVTMNNATQRNGDNYWNADGFVTDWGTYNITYEDTSAAGNTDGGYDLKSKDTKLIRAKAADNKRNFRIWRSAIMEDVISDEPFRRGGIGTTAHIHVLGDEGDLTINGGTFTGEKGIDNIIFDLDDRGSLEVNGAKITDNRYTLRTVAKGDIEIRNLVEE